MNQSAARAKFEELKKTEGADCLWMDGKRVVIRKNGKTIFRYPKSLRVKFVPEYRSWPMRANVLPSGLYGYGMDGMALGMARLDD